MLYCTLGSGAGGRRPHADTLMSDERDAMYVSHVVMAHGRLSPVVSAGSGWLDTGRPPPMHWENENAPSDSLCTAYYIPRAGAGECWDHQRLPPSS